MILIKTKQWIKKGWIKALKLVNLVYQKLLPLIFFLKFTFRRYDYRQFDPRKVKENLKKIIIYGQIHWLDSNASGQIFVLKKPSEKWGWQIKNFLFFGALRSRLKQVLYLSFLTFLIELTNPFDQSTLKWILKKKKEFISRAKERLKKLNGKFWDISFLDYELYIYEKRSLLQLKIIKEIISATEQSKKSESIKEATLAIQKGIFPLLIIQGCSGAYWIRNQKREIIGLFKPFDEEIHAPNNPLGPKYQGALGERKTRLGNRVGEACHREVAAYQVDIFLGFGIVPHTSYACFKHQSFFDARENVSSIKKNKTKYGSFQEYVEGFQTFLKASDQEREKLPLEEFQLLVLLDIIIGNTDRNAGNFLISDGKIAAVDHGLCFPDLHEKYTTWYWEIPLGENSFYPSIIDLFYHFPLEKLFFRLKKRCFISVPSLNRMKERIAFCKAAIELEINSPKKLAGFFNPELLHQLTDLDETLIAKSKELLSQSQLITD